MKYRMKAGMFDQIITGNDEQNNSCIINLFMFLMILFQNFTFSYINNFHCIQNMN